MCKLVCYSPKPSLLSLTSLVSAALESLPADLQQNFTRMRETDLKAQSKLHSCALIPRSSASYVTGSLPFPIPDAADKLDKKIKSNFVANSKKGGPANKDALYKQVC